MPDLGPQDGYDVGSARKQWPNMTDGGCMAANGDECSILRFLSFFAFAVQQYRPQVSILPTVPSQANQLIFR